MPLRTIMKPGNTFRGLNLRAPQQSPRPGQGSDDVPHSTLVGGSLLLQKGLGQTYDSIDEYEHLTGRHISGGGLGAGLSEVAKKLKQLKQEPLKRKPKNIRFTL